MFTIVVQHVSMLMGMSLLSIIYVKLFNDFCLFISDAKPTKTVRRTTVLKKEVVSVLKKEHLNVTKAGKKLW